MNIAPLLRRRSAHFCVAALAWAIAVSSVQAQTGVVSITTSTTDLGNTNTNGTTFENTTTSVQSFLDTYGNKYTANTVANASYVRRNTTAGNSNNTSAWYDEGSTATRFSAPYATTDPSLLLGNNVLRGSDNTFANGTDATTGNIERLDFVFSAGIVVNLSTAFAVFDRGAVGAHDSVKIAVITGWNTTTNQVTTYGGNLVGVQSTNYGSSNVVADFTYNLFRYSNGDNLGGPGYWNDNTETATQGIGGAIISMSDLGIAAGTTIYGYSLMGYDVTNGGSMSNLLDWNNTTYFRSDTTGATGTGGIDLSAVNGVLYNKVAPEPSTYGALFMGAMLTGWYLRRKFARTAGEALAVTVRAA